MKLATSARVRKAIESEDIEALRLALSFKQLRFCEEYAIDLNATAAARRAGYAPAYIDRQASTLLHHEGVRYYIDHLTKSQAAKIMSVDPDYVITRVMDIVNKDGAKDTDRLRGLELLARHLGMFIERTEITGKDGEALQIEQRTKQEVQSVLAALRSMSKKNTRLSVVGGSDFVEDERTNIDTEENDVG